jgi:hypothetical protein
VLNKRRTTPQDNGNLQTPASIFPDDIQPPFWKAHITRIIQSQEGREVYAVFSSILLLMLKKN